MEDSAAYRQRCYECYRPVDRCFCAQIPRIENRTQILILQHVKERFHAFNTARIVRKSLQNCQLIVDQTQRLADTALPFTESTGILYPDPNARLLSDLPPDQRPDQLVILDGTWHHAKTFMKQIPALQRLPRFCLQPGQPSNYRIRLEPTETALSTLEATVAALQYLEPELAGLQGLLSAFDYMVDRQIEHPMQSGRIRRRPSDRPWKPKANIPTALLADPSQLVVAYGEAAHGAGGIRTKQRQPVYWAAQRLVTGERFECALQTEGSLTEDFLSHLRLQRSDFSDALTHEQFAKAWNRFLKPDDSIVVFNQSTLKLLETAGARAANGVVLKSVNIQAGSSTLPERMAALGLQSEPVEHRGRAGERLGNAIAFTHYLHQLGRQNVAPTSG